MKQLRRVVTAVVGVLPEVLVDSLGVGGTLAIAYGAWEIYRPAGWIAGGVFALSGALLMARGR
jgi:hypothetical protein